jgi:hypothetical protein
MGQAAAPSPRPSPASLGQRHCPNKSPPLPVSSLTRLRRSAKPTSPPASPAKARGRSACRRSSTRWKRWGACGVTIVAL